MEKSEFGVTGFTRVTNEDIAKFQKLAYKIIYDEEFGDELDMDEKISEGMIGVAVGLATFDPSKGISLAHWVAWNVTKRIRDATRLTCRQLRYAKDEDLQESMFKNIKRRKDDKTSNLALLLRDTDEEKKSSIIKNALDVLDDDERLCVQRVYLDSLTQAQFARERGVSQSWVSRVLRDALKKIKREFEEREFEIDLNYNPV